MSDYATDRVIGERLLKVLGLEGQGVVGIDVHVRAGQPVRIVIDRIPYAEEADGVARALEEDRYTWQHVALELANELRRCPPTPERTRLLRRVPGLDLGDIPLAELGLPTVIYNLLRRAGIDTVDRLRQTDQGMLERIRGLGPTHIATITRLLA